MVSFDWTMFSFGKVTVHLKLGGQLTVAILQKEKLQLFRNLLPLVSQKTLLKLCFYTFSPKCLMGLVKLTTVNSCQVVAFWEQMNIQQKKKLWLFSLRDCLHWVGEKELVAFLDNETVSEEKKRCEQRKEPFMSLIQVVQGHGARCTLADCSPRIHRSFLFLDVVQAALPQGAWRSMTSTLFVWARICACVCVCSRGAETSNYLHFLQTACPPKAPCQASCPSLLTGWMYCRTRFCQGCCGRRAAGLHFGLWPPLNSTWVSFKSSWTKLLSGSGWSVPLPQFPEENKLGCRLISLISFLYLQVKPKIKLFVHCSVWSWVEQ